MRGPQNRVLRGASPVPSPRRCGGWKHPATARRCQLVACGVSASPVVVRIAATSALQPCVHVRSSFFSPFLLSDSVREEQKNSPLYLKTGNGADRRGAGGFDRGEQDVELERRINAQGQAKTPLRASYALQGGVDSAARAIHRGPTHSSHRPACVSNAAYRGAFMEHGCHRL